MSQTDPILTLCRTLGVKGLASSMSCLYSSSPPPLPPSKGDVCGGAGGGGSSGGCLPREGVKLSGQGGQISGSREEARATGGPAARRLCLNPSLCRTQARGFITPAAARADPSLSFLLSYLIFFFLSNTISGFLRSLVLTGS